MKKLITVFFLSCFILGGIWAEEAIKEEKINYYSESLESYRNGSYEQAIETLDKAIAENNEVAKARYLKALSLDKLARLDEAIAEYKEAEKLDAEDGKILVNLAWACYRNSDVAAAEKYSQQATEKAPDNARAFRVLGLAYFDQGKTDMAESAFKKAIELNPDSPYVHNNLGLIYLNNNDFAAAVSEFEKAVSSASPTSYMYNNLGISYERLDEFNKAQEAYQKALDTAPDYHKARANLERVKNILEKQ